MGGNTSSKYLRRRRERGHSARNQRYLYDTDRLYCDTNLEQSDRRTAILPLTTEGCSASSNIYDSYCFDTNKTAELSNSAEEDNGTVHEEIQSQPEAESSSDGYVGAETHINEERPKSKVHAVPAVPVTRASQAKATSTSTETLSRQMSESRESDINLPNFKVTADSAGGTFYSRELLLSGTIPEEAVDQEINLCFCKEESQGHSAELKPTQRFISDIYHILPHGMTFGKQIILRFPHRSSRTTAFRNSVPCVRTRRKVLYSPTRISEGHQWEEIASERTTEAHRHDIRAVITPEEACLMLLRFCSFVAIEEEIQTKYIVAQVYARGLDDGGVELTVAFISPEGSSTPRISPCSVLLDEHNVCLVADIDTIRVRAKLNDQSDGWQLFGNGNEKVLKTHFLWNDRSQHSTYFMRKAAATHNEQLYLDIEIEHDEILEIPLAINLKQIRSPVMPRGDISGMTSPSDPRPIEEPLFDTSQTSVKERVPVLPLTAPSVNVYNKMERNDGHDKATDPYTSLQVSLKSDGPQARASSMNGSDQNAMKYDHARRPLPAIVETDAIHQSDFTSATQQVVVNVRFGTGGIDCGLNKMPRLTKPKLSHFKKIELSRILERQRIDGRDWRALADRMGLHAFESIIENDRSGSTRCLLNLWESEEGPRGSVDFLVDSLKAIRREDAAAIIVN